MGLRFLTFAVLLVAATAHGRDTDGALDTLLLPNSGRPAIAVAGEAIEIHVRGEVSALALVADGRNIRLDAVPLSGGFSAGMLHAVLPTDTPTGVYALRAGDDLNPGAVHVVAGWPERYRIAFLAAERLTADAAAEAMATATDAGAALLLVAGVDETFSELVPILDASPLPVLICPAARGVGSFETYFGTVVHGFRFAVDGFLCFGGTDDAVESEGADAAALQYWQRRLRASRWRIGVGPSAGPGLPLRIQTVLFVDNPLDYCFVAASSFDGEDLPIRRSPWGDTYVAAPPGDGASRLVIIEVGPAGLSLAPLEEAE